MRAMFGMFCACLAAFAGPAANCKDAERAEEFNLSQVQISRDSPFYKAMEIDKKYLLGYDYDRLVAYSRREAGLPEKAAPYGSWEMAAPNGGATAGHALSALSMLYASTRDPQVLEKINFLVDEFSACQDSDGYINMGQKNRELLEKIKRKARGNFYKDRYLLLGTWAPFYWRHKVYAGLRDAWVFAGNKKAKDCFLKGCDWLCDYMDNFSDEEFENILHTEHGGFNEVLCDASKIMEDKQKYAPANTPESEKILSRALDSVDIAEQQPEIDHKFKQGRGAELFTYKDRVSRRAKDWISYELTVPADKFKKSMKLKLFTERLGSQFPCRYKILVNGAEIAECRREKSEGEKFIFDYYEIPQELVEKSEGKFLVKFEMLEREVEPLFRVGIVN